MADGAGTRPGSAKTQLGAGVRKAKDTGLVIPQSSAMEILPPEGGVAGLSGGTLSGALVHRSANTPALSQSRSRPSSAKSVSSVASVRPPSGSTRQTGKPRARTQGAGREADDRPDDRPAKAAFESTQHTAGIKPVPGHRTHSSSSLLSTRCASPLEDGTSTPGALLQAASPAVAPASVEEPRKRHTAAAVVPPAEPAQQRCEPGSKGGSSVADASRQAPAEPARHRAEEPRTPEQLSAQQLAPSDLASHGGSTSSGESAAGEEKARVAVSESAAASPDGAAEAARAMHAGGAAAVQDGEDVGGGFFLTGLLSPQVANGSSGVCTSPPPPYCCPYPCPYCTLTQAHSRPPGEAAAGERRSVHALLEERRARRVRHQRQARAPRGQGGQGGDARAAAPAAGRQQGRAPARSGVGGGARMRRLGGALTAVSALDVMTNTIFAKQRRRLRGDPARWRRKSFLGCLIHACMQPNAHRRARGCRALSRVLQSQD